MVRLRDILASNLKTYRTQLGYSQGKLADLVDTAQTYVAMIENGKRFPSDIMIEKIAIALNKEAYELFLMEPYQKTVQEKWKDEILSKLEQFIHKNLREMKNDD
jgi:transcriptional regulator with XRE-family HTH domain